MRIKRVRGYVKKDGTVVKPYIRTYPDKHSWNNLNPRPKRQKRHR